jgi:16S rRNA C1402 (ribose-2'-O) methylase RsmI
MADAVTTRVVTESPERITVHLTNISDATGESAVVKVDLSTLTAEDGGVPASLDIEEVRWNIQGFTSVRVLWGTTSAVVALALSGSGYDDFRGDSFAYAKRGLSDPRTATGERDILLTTAGAVSGATYDITLRLRKSPD